MDFSVLGPLRVEGPDGAIEIRGAKERLLLARLIAAGGRIVPTSELIDTLWGDEPPASAAKSLQTFVLRLRNVLEPDRRGSPALLLTAGPGYRLAVEPGQVDAERFTRLARIGERALADGRPEQAAATMTEALTLWRGRAYSGFEASDIAAEARALEELRLGALEVRIAARLALGEATAAVPELERLVAEEPMRERGWEMLVTALYATGRQGDALGAYERARTVLAEELGVDPGPGLRAVHARVLAHDPALGRASARSTLPPELRPARELVGRQRELERLLQEWQSAVRGRPRTIVVRGPQGGGGTALASALAAEAARGGATVRYVSSATPADVVRDWSAPQGTSVLLVADHVESDLPATLTVRLTGRLGPVPDGADVLELAPLSATDVRRIVADYLPEDETLAVAEEALARTGGWPGPVHEAALDAARRRATQRVEVAAATAGTRSAELARARAELAEGVELLRDTDATVEPFDAAVCPWRGLRSYEVEDARWFAGRERLVAELVARLAGARLLSLVGASGSGKSSVLRAGLLAALANDALPGSAGWRVVTLRPGSHPMRELARRSLGSTGRDEVADLLAHLVSGSEEHDGRVVVAVDQFEEVWTVCSDDAERGQFLDTLAELATDPRSSVSVVVAVRADFMGELAGHDALRPLVNDGTVLVGPMTPPEVRRAVERPAAAGRLVLDDGLADTIVSDAGAEPGLLPLLSATMTQLWERREGTALTYAAYVTLGGLSGAIATLAEDTFTGLSPTQQDTARLLLMRLTGPGDGAGVTRRRVALSEVDSLPRDDVREVVEELSAGRLLTVSDGHVEVAHEALFREWPRLRGWLVEDAAGRAVQRRLAVAAGEWDAEGRESSALWTGARLASGLEVAEARPEEVTPVEREFLDAGLEALDAEQRAAQDRARLSARQNRRLRRLIAGIGVVLVVALVAGLLAWRAQRAAQAASLSAEAKGLAASALNIEYPDLALLAAVEATKLEQSPETYGALLTLLARQPQVAHRVRTENRFLRIAASPDGQTVFVTENAPIVQAIDAETGAVRWTVEMPEGGQAGQPSVTSDGSGVIVPEFSDPSGVVRLDADTGELVWARRGLDSVAPAASPWAGHGGLRADGRYIVTTDTHLVTLDADSGEVIDAVAWPEPVHFADLFRVWPDGRVSQDWPDRPGVGMLFDPRRPQDGVVELDGVPLSFSPDGTRMVLARIGDPSSELRVASTADLQRTSQWVRIPAFVRGAPWSPDGARVVVTTTNGIQPLDPDTMALGTESVGHSAVVMDARFTGRRGDLVWTAGRDGTAVAFDLSGSRTPITSRPADPQPHTGDSDASGQVGVYLDLLPEDPNTAYLTDLSSGRDLGELVIEVAPGSQGWDPVLEFQATAVAVTDDGATAVVGVEAFDRAEGPVLDRGLVAIFDADTRRQRALVDLPWPVHSLAVTPDGSRAVVNGLAGFAVVDLAAEAVVGVPASLEEAGNIEWTHGTEVSPDGRLAALARNGEIVLVDVAAGRVERRESVTRKDDGLVQALAWASDSSAIAAGSDSGWLHVVSADTLQPIAPPRLITGGWVIDLEVSPTGHLMASTGSDGDVTLWDTQTWRPYGQPVTESGTFGWLSYTEDGSLLRAFFEEVGAIEISTDPADWVRAACAAAGRNLTAEESAVILPERPLQPTCAEHE